MGICFRTTFTSFQTLCPRKRGFLRETHRYHFDGRSSSESKEPQFRLLEIEANADPNISNKVPGHVRNRN